MNWGIILYLVGPFAGLAIMLYGIIPLIVALKKYEKVKAICIRVDSQKDEDSTTYRPVWEYYYNGQKYISNKGSSSSSLNIPVGKEKIIYVNPHNPNKTYTIVLSDIIFRIAFGAVFSGIGIKFLLSFLSRQ